MTTTRILAIGAMGGLAALLGVIVVAAIAVALYTAITRLVDGVQNWRERRYARRDLEACQTIYALDATDPDGSKEPR